MRTPRVVAFLALMAMLPQLTGCRTFRPYGRSLPELSRGAESLGTVRITNVDGEKLVVTGAWVSENELHGLLEAPSSATVDAGEVSWGSREVTVPINQIREIEKRRFDVGRTVLLGMGIAIGSYLVVGYLAMADWGSSSAWYSPGP